MAQNIATLAVKFVADTFGLKSGAKEAEKVVTDSARKIGGNSLKAFGDFFKPGGNNASLSAFRKFFATPTADIAKSLAPKMQQQMTLMQRAAELAKNSIAGRGGLAGALTEIGPAGVVAGGAVVAALAGVAAAGYTAYKAIEQFNASAARIDATSKLATRLDATYETLQKLTFVAGRSGVPLDALAKAMEKMAREVGSGGEPLDVAFAKQAKRIGEIADPAKRAAEAYRVFGKSGTELIPLLKNIAADSERFERFNRSFNFGISDRDSQNVERMNDAWGDLVFIGTQLADKFVSKFGGPVADFLEEGIRLLEQWAAAFEDSGVRWEDIGNIANNAMRTMTLMVHVLNNELKTTFYLLGQLSRFSSLIGSINPLAARMLSPSDSSPQDFAPRGGFNGGGALSSASGEKFAGAALENSLEAARIIQGRTADPAAIAMRQEALAKQQLEATNELLSIFRQHNPVLAVGGI